MVHLRLVRPVDHECGRENEECKHLSLAEAVHFFVQQIAVFSSYPEVSSKELRAYTEWLRPALDATVLVKSPVVGDGRPWLSPEEITS